MRFSEKMQILKEKMKEYKGKQILRSNLIIIIEETLDVNRQSAMNYINELMIRGIIKEVSRQVYEYVGE